MKRSPISQLGVTLLEIMLVLAVAAMIIIMSVRYYQSATVSQQANSVLQQIQAISAAADTYAQGAGGYTGLNASGGSAGNLPLASPNLLNLPWGGTAGVSGQSATTYQITLTGIPNSVCTIISARIGTGGKYTVATDCSTISYNAAG